MTLRMAPIAEAQIIHRSWLKFAITQKNLSKMTAVPLDRALHFAFEMSTWKTQSMYVYFNVSIFENRNTCVGIQRSTSELTQNFFGAART